jgi:hypothetical protein
MGNVTEIRHRGQLTAAGKAEIGKKNKMLDEIKRGLVAEGYTVLGSKAESETVAFTVVTAQGSDKQLVFRHENGQRTDITDAVLKAGTPHNGTATIGIEGRDLFTRGTQLRVSGSYERQGDAHVIHRLVPLGSAYQVAIGKQHWVGASNDVTDKESLAQRLSYKLGRDTRVRTVGQDGKGHYVMTAFNSKTGNYKRLIVDKTEGGPLKYQVAESNRLAEAKALVRETEIERGHRDIKSIDLVSPTASGDGLIFDVKYKTAGKKARQFVVDFGHPLEPHAKDFVFHYSLDGNSTDRHTIQLVEKAVASVLSDHHWIHEAHRIPNLTSSTGTVIVAYGEDFVGEDNKKAETIRVQTVAIDQKNRSFKSKWNTGDDKKHIDYTARVLDAVKAQTGKEAFLGSHLQNGASDSLKERNTTLSIITKNGNARVHSDGKDYIVNMERLIAGKKTDLVMPDTSKKALRVGAEVDDSPAPVPAPAA